MTPTILALDIAPVCDRGKIVNVSAPALLVAAGGMATDAGGLMQRDDTTIPNGFCQCGCGQRTPLAKSTRLEHGRRRGEPLPYLHQHRLRVERRSIAARFWAKVEGGGPDDCWQWTGSRQHSGHGRFQASAEGEPKRIVQAHRWAFEQANGPIPNGLIVRHACDNPACVNPAHLQLGTQQDNVDDMWHRGRGFVPTAVPQPGTANPNAKLSASDVVEIRRRRQRGETGRSVARSFGISPSQVSRILTGKRWRHCDCEGEA